MSPPMHRRAARGLTLIELLVALGVSALTIAAAVALLVQQQRAYTNSSGDRAQQEAGRMALKEITTRLRQAGYGVDPSLTFDFGQVDVAPRAGLPAPALSVRQGTYLCATAVDCRDTTGLSDEVVFHARDPLFSRRASKVEGELLTLIGDLRQPIYAGQILQVSCIGSTQLRAFVTVKTTKLPPAAPAVPNPAAPVLIELEPGQDTSGRPVFPFENAVLAGGCFNQAAPDQPVVTKVDRFRFHVGWFTENGGAAAAGADGARPYLMLDRGLAGAVGDVPVAADVEDLQLTYFYPPAAAGQANRMVGGTPGTAASAEAFPIEVDVIAPAYEDAPDAASRATGHPANIEAVRVSVVVRSAEADLVALSNPADRTLPAAGNRAEVLGQPGYRRTLFETTVVIPNLRSTRFNYPMVNAAGGQGFNLGGG